MVLVFTETHTTIKFEILFENVTWDVCPSELELRFHSCHTVTEVRFFVIVMMLKYLVSFSSSCSVS